MHIKCKFSDLAKPPSPKEELVAEKPKTEDEDSKETVSQESSTTESESFAGLSRSERFEKKVVDDTV